MKQRLFVLLSLFLVWQLAAETLTGSDLSLAVEKRIAKAGFSVSRFPLAETSQDLFQFNITVDFNNAPQENAGRLLFSFTQEDVYNHLEQFLSFLKHFEELPHTQNVTVLCTAGDVSPTGLSRRRTGSEEYALVAKDLEDTAVIVVDFEKSTALYTGGYRRTTPRWLAETVVQAFYAQKQLFLYPTAVTSFYRLGFIEAAPRMEAFMREDLPAVRITLSPEQDFSLLEELCRHAPSLETMRFWDSHYLLIPFPYPLKTIIIGERVFVISALILGSFSLLILCSFSLAGANAAKEKKRFFRSWFMIPLTISVLFFAILIGQLVASHAPALKDASALIKLGTKIAVAALVISVLFALQEMLRAPVSLFIYSDMPLYIAACNIFFFAAIDLQFFLPLIIEYAILYRARRTGHIAKLSIALFCLLLPFCPYIFTIMANGKAEAINQLIFCDVRLNFLFALLFLPFQILWLRILLGYNLFRHAGKKLAKNTILRTLFSVGMLCSIIFAFVLTLSLISRSFARKAVIKATIIQRDRNTISVDLSRSTFSDLTTEHVSIRSAVKAVRYEVSLETEAGAVPLYDASYRFTLNEGARRAQFDIPDYPPQHITIDYAFSSDTKGMLSITALYKTDTAGVYRAELRTIPILGSHVKDEP